MNLKKIKEEEIRKGKIQVEIELKKKEMEELMKKMEQNE